MDAKERAERLARLAESGLPIPVEEWKAMGRPGDPEPYLDTKAGQ